MAGPDPICELEALIHTAVDDPGLLEIYDVATEALRKSFALAYSTPSFETGDVFAWVFQAADGFLNLLREPTQEALCILAHFCVLLKRLDYYVSLLGACLWMAF